MSQEDPYVYPGTTILRNLLDIRDPKALDYLERNIVQTRIEEGVPAGGFDLAHLKAIHRHLFQDIYAWAGEVRTVEINKGGSQFQFRQFIETGMADVHKRLVAANFLRGLSPETFAAQAGEIIGDVNYVHPFREGNGRTQLQYLKLLGGRAFPRFVTIDSHGLDRGIKGCPQRQLQTDGTPDPPGRPVEGAAVGCQH